MTSRNLHISKAAYEAAFQRNIDINKSTTYPSSIWWCRGEPDMSSPEWEYQREDYMSNLQIITNYLMYNSHKKSVTGQKNKYFITFTHNNNTPKDDFKKAVEKQLERKIFTHVEYAFEHEETNIHCHAIVESKFTLNSLNFKSHSTKHGYVQIKIIKHDNGLQDYINKENPSSIL